MHTVGFLLALLLGAAAALVPFALRRPRAPPAALPDDGRWKADWERWRG